MRSLALLLAAALPLAAPLSAHAQTEIYGQAPQGRPDHPGFAPMAKLLDLSPEQQGQMKAIREKHQGALKADHEAARAQSQAFHAAMEDSKADPAQLRQAYDQMNAARFQALLEGRAMRAEMRAILTPDQQAKADAMKAQFRERMKARSEARRAAWRQRAQEAAPQNP